MGQFKNIYCDFHAIFMCMCILKNQMCPVIFYKLSVQFVQKWVKNTFFSLLALETI